MSIVVLVALAGTSSRALAAHGNGTAGPHEAAVVNLAGPSLEIPMDLATGRPMIELSLNGHGPYRFVFDTGAGGLVIDAGLARELSLAVVGRDSLGDPNNPGAYQVDVVRVDSVTLGTAGEGKTAPLTLRGATASTFEVRQMMGSNVGGIIGLPSFQDLLVTLDYPGGKVRFERGELAAGGAGVVEYTSPEGIIVLPITVADTTLTAHLDSGNPGAFMLPYGLTDHLHFKSPPAEIGQARTVNSNATIYAATLAGDIRAAGLTWSNPEVHLSELIEHFANIGMEAFRDAAITVDQRHHRLRMERSATAAAPAPPRRRLGIMFAGMAPGPSGIPIVDGGFRIERVVPGALAEKAGMKAGDVVLSVNGRSVSDIAPAELSDVFGKPGELQLRVKRGGQEMAIVIP